MLGYGRNRCEDPGGNVRDEPADEDARDDRENHPHEAHDRHVGIEVGSEPGADAGDFALVWNTDKPAGRAGRPHRGSAKTAKRRLGLNFLLTPDAGHGAPPPVSSITE